MFGYFNRNYEETLDLPVGESRLDAGEAQRSDVLAIDAFSSDAIPIHLLTLTLRSLASVERTQSLHPA